jgi:16S rRNA (cytosine967-C5)-methyltransferase
MRLHYSLMQSIVNTLHSIFYEGKMADKAIQHVLKSDKRLGSRDRAFIAEHTYDIVRWWRLLHFINESAVTNVRKDVLWKILGIRLRMIDIDLPPIDEFKSLNRQKIKQRLELAKEHRKVIQSIPDWLDVMGSQELGDQWTLMLQALNNQAPIGIRVNTLKTDYIGLAKSMKEEGHELVRLKDVEDAAYIKVRANVFGTKCFKDGLFEMQDPGSQLIAQYLGVEPGMRVIDACAGAGGKTLHLAALMQNKGTIIAMDVEEWKLEELKKRARRNGAHNIDTRVITGKVVKRLKESADALLLDVPCSGLGVLRRNPDAKWKLKPEFIEEMQQKQAAIIQQYAQMVKIGGKMVYATCSILPSENEVQVQKFLSQNANYSLVKQHHTSPVTDGFDGFYMALIERKN